MRRGRLEHVVHAGLQAERVPVGLVARRPAAGLRIVWGTGDRLLPWPSAAARFRTDWLPHADWVELDGIGHCPQLDVPLETAQLILGFTAGWAGARPAASRSGPGSVRP